jgi:hypothetical protein
MAKKHISQKSVNVARTMVLVAGLPIWGLAPAFGQQAGEDPYAPLGIRAGTFILYPEIEIREGTTDNATGAAQGQESSTFAEVQGRISAQSDWARHSLTGLLRGGYTSFQDVSGEDDSNLDADATLTFDVRSDTQLALAIGYGLNTEDNIDDKIYRAGAELSHRFNRLTASVRGTINEFDFGDRGTVSLGSLTEDAVADYDEKEIAARLTYEVSPALSVFGEVSTNSREFDQQIDMAGFLRGSDGYTVTIGTNLDLASSLRGSISIGRQVQSPDDPSFSKIEDVVYAANLTWAATGLTNVTLDAQSDIGETTFSGSPGVVRRSITLGVNHALKRNIELNGSVTYGRNEFVSTGPVETEITSRFGIAYLLSRNVALTASYSRFSFDSTFANADYTVNSFIVGLRLRR